MNIKHASEWSSYALKKAAGMLYTGFTKMNQKAAGRNFDADPDYSWRIRGGKEKSRGNKEQRFHYL